MQTYTNTAVMGRSAFSSEHFWKWVIDCRDMVMILNIDDDKTMTE